MILIFQEDLYGLVFSAICGVSCTCFYSGWRFRFEKYSVTVDSETGEPLVLENMLTVVGREEKSLLCDPGSELRLRRVKKKENVRIYKDGMSNKKS